MKKIYVATAIITFIAIFFLRWQLWFFKSQPVPDMPIASWDGIPFYYPNFYYPSACCGVAGQSFAAHWSVSGLFILLAFWILINLILFFIIKKVFGKTEAKNI